MKPESRRGKPYQIWLSDSESENMKPLPAPHVLGKTEFERFDNALRQVLSVSKEELLKREQRDKKKSKAKRSKK